MVVTRSDVTALWGARDTSGTVYLWAEHHFPYGEPSQNAMAIKKLGRWIPGLISFSGSTISQADKDRLTEIYRDLGLKVEASVQGEAAGACQMSRLLAENKLKSSPRCGSFSRSTDSAVSSLPYSSAANCLP